MIYGYARVSTNDQDTQMQLDAFRRSGVDLVVEEKCSAVSARPELRVLLKRLQPSDTLIVYKLDRLARSLKDLLQILEQLEHIGCGFRSITEPIDTVSAAGRLMLNILGSVAEFERSLIRERAFAGQIAAARQGRWPGRPRKLTADQEHEVFRRWRDGETKAALARDLGVSHDVVKMAIYRRMHPVHPRVQLDSRLRRAVSDAQ